MYNTAEMAYERLKTLRMSVWTIWWAWILLILLFICWREQMNSCVVGDVLEQCLVVGCVRLGGSAFGGVSDCRSFALV